MARRWSLVLTILVTLGAARGATAAPAPRADRSVARAVTISAYCVEPEEAAFLALIKDYRRQHGLGALATCQTAGAAAEHHSADLAAKNSSATRSAAAWAGPKKRRVLRHRARPGFFGVGDGNPAPCGVAFGVGRTRHALGPMSSATTGVEVRQDLLRAGDRGCAHPVWPCQLPYRRPANGWGTGHGQCLAGGTSGRVAAGPDRGGGGCQADGQGWPVPPRSPVMTLIAPSPSM